MPRLSETHRGGTIFVYVNNHYSGYALAMAEHFLGVAGMNTCEVEKASLEDLENRSLCSKPATRLFVFKVPAGAASFLRKRFYACNECAAKFSADYVKEVSEAH